MAGVQALSMQACFRYQSIKTSTTLIFTCLSNQLPLGAGANQKEDWTLRLGPCWPRAFEGIHQTRNYMWPVCAFFPGGLLIFHWSPDVLIDIQFECCKSVSWKTIFTLQFMEIGCQLKSVKSAWKTRKNTVKVSEKPVILGSLWSARNIYMFLKFLQPSDRSFPAYPCSTMGESKIS